jgi:hypothetical protein
MANGHGGARPGSGRKRQATVVEQASRRSVVLDVIDNDEWRETVQAWLLLSRETPSVIYPLLPYLLGSPKQDINVSGTVKTEMTISGLRKVLGIDE